MRCGTVAPLKPYGSGYLWLCAACPLASVACAEYEHPYRGSGTPGVWVCVTCGTCCVSQPIKTEPEAPAPVPTPDWDC
jgi:hypothetical protein